MSFKPFLFKPRWQHKDPEVRARAVATEHDPELLDALSGICLEDPEAQVRAAAIKRLIHLPTLLRAAERTTGPKEQTLITERLRALTTSRGNDRPPLQDRLAIVQVSQDRTLLESVALHAPESELRSAALGRVDRQGVLGDASIGDPEPANRRLAASRITQQSTLQRVIDAVRKSDKALHQELQARLHAQRLAAGDPKAVAAEALQICTTLEALAAQPRSASEKEITACEQAWSAIADLAPEAYRQRCSAVIERLRRPPREQGPSEQPASRVQTESRTDTELPAPQPVKPAPQPAPAGQQDADNSALFEELEDKLALLIEQVEAGELHNALATRSKLLDAGKPLRRDRRWKRIQRELHGVHGQLRELRDWLHWSNNKIRKRLIRDMHALPGSGLHPDAVLQKLKELQAEWKELEHSEQIPGEKHFSAPPWMWSKFNQAGRAAFELTKPFLDKRSEVQQSHLDELRAVCGQLIELSRMDEPDWGELRKTMSRASRGLRSLGQIPARARKKMASELRKSLETAKERQQAHYAEVEKIKRKLVRSAAQIQHMDNRDEAMTLAKSLQAEWKAAGSLWRSLEQKLWEEFRKPIDPLFEQLKAERQAEQAEHDEDFQVQKDLCAALEKLLESEDEELAALRGRVQGLEEAWQEVSRPAARLRRDFQARMAHFDERIKRHERRQAGATRERWWLKADLLHALEAAMSGVGRPERAAEKALNVWPEPTPADVDIDAALDQRRDAASANTGGTNAVIDPETAEQARLLCIRLEFLAGLPSPKSEQELRMRYQVERLSASMAGDSERVPVRLEAREAESQWLTLGFVPDPQHDAFRVRIRKAIREIYKE